MKDLRIVFIGTPDFAVASLKAVIEAKQNVVAVITAPDKKAGRGKKIRYSAVKEFALAQNLPLLQPENLKDETFLNTLESYQADIQIVVAFRMLPKAVWNMPPMGTFNLHGSLLPQYRGAAPINWAIINGETQSGVTTFLLKHEIDTGAVLLQERVEILPEDNVGSLYEKLMHTGAQLVVKTLEQLTLGSYELKDQEELAKQHETLKSAPKLNKEICAIDWTKDVTSIHNHIRGLSPYPCAFTKVKLDDKTLGLKLFKSSIDLSHCSDTAQIIQEKKRLGVVLPTGTIWLEEIQLEGKKRMEIGSFLPGLQSELKLA